MLDPIRNDVNLWWNYKEIIELFVIFYTSLIRFSFKLHSTETLIFREAAGGTELFAKHSKMPEYERLTL
jgi:hypothetical protein